MKNRIALWLIPLLIVIDQIIKLLVKEKVYVIFNFPLILYRKNFGAAFSLFEGERLFLIFASLIIIGFIFYYYNQYKRLQFGFNLILAGSISNLIDRIVRGYIADFINVGIWPVFNLADIYNIVGVFFIIIMIIKGKIK